MSDTRVTPAAISSLKTKRKLTPTTVFYRVLYGGWTAVSTIITAAVMAALAVCGGLTVACMPLCTWLIYLGTTTHYQLNETEAFCTALGLVCNFIVFLSLYEGITDKLERKFGYHYVSEILYRTHNHIKKRAQLDE